MIVADLTQTPRAPVPGDPHELPTIQIDDVALAAAEKSRFDVSADRTAAPRTMRAGALSKPLREERNRTNRARRLARYVAAPAVLGIVALAYSLARREPPPAKVIVTPSPPVAADLVIDGRPSGQLPPFVHTLAPGKHRIELRAEGYKPFSATVDVKAGAMPIELTAKLEADHPLQVEGVVLAPSRLPPPPAVAPPPPRKPQAARKPMRAPDNVAPVEQLLRAEGPPIAAATPVAPGTIGYLVVQSKPAARLTIDGRDTGRWTPVPAANPIVLPAGSHTVVFESADGRRHEERVEIEAGKTARFVRALP